MTGGEAGIRTLETGKGLLDFESSAFDHSATSPGRHSPQVVQPLPALPREMGCAFGGVIGAIEVE
jgi:hypothetical protein